MANVVVVGGQWGDEGKGKVVDLLTEHVAVCARFGGGHNAGHTVKIGEVRYPLQLVPCGILRPHVTCVIGNGVVIEPGKLLSEVDQLLAQGIEVEGRLLVSDRAHVILPHHPIVDRTREQELAGDKLGTTSRGIGPAYEDKHARVGFRIADLFDPRAEKHLVSTLESRNEVIRKLWGADPLPVEQVASQFLGPGGHRDRLRPFVADTATYLARRMEEDAGVLMEGAQGALLDIDHGTYPYVTSSSSVGNGPPPTRVA